MTKRHCYVTNVGDAIEALADALDPERKKPFGGDILDLLEWAERDVLETRQQLAASKEELSRARLKNAIVYGTSHPEIYKTKEDELRQQVTLLREPLLYIDEVAKTSKTIISVAAAAMKMLKKIRAALAATEPKL